jgi:phosphoserine phosphatase
LNDEKNYVVVTVSGRDRPGITAAFARILVDHGVEIVDIDQAALHDFLGLSFLLDLGGTSARDTVLKDLLDRQLENLFVLTFFGGTAVLAEVASVLGEHNANIRKISNLSIDSAHCIELVVDMRSVPSLSRLKSELMQRSHDLNVDIALQNIEAYRKSKRIVFFDMDRTLIDTEVIDEMARVRRTREDPGFSEALRRGGEADRTPEGARFQDRPPERGFRLLYRTPREPARTRFCLRKQARNQEGVAHRTCGGRGDR